MSTWTATYLPTFAADIGTFDPETLVGVAVLLPDGGGAYIDGIDTLTNSVECMLENTDLIRAAWVSKVTETRVEIAVTREANEDPALPIAMTLIFEKVTGTSTCICDG